MKKPVHAVTDHAVIRYLERVEGIDIDALRHEIGRRVDRALRVGARSACVDGFRYIIEEGRVVTVHAQHLPDKRVGRRHGGSDGRS